MNPTLASLRRDAEPSNKKSRFPAWLIPAGIFGGFVILFVFLFGDRLLPAEEREVRAVLASERPQDESPTASETASESRGEGATAFQASGWIEPDPLPVRATALINGVVDQVHVLEGDLVEEGQVLATLIRQDFDLALATARQDRRMREAAVETQRQAVRVARESLRGARANLELAAATVEETEDRKQRVDRLSRGAIAEAEEVSARVALRRARAAKETAAAAVESATVEIEREKARARELEQALGRAEVAEQVAELSLSRTEVRSPMRGRVMRLMVSPGQKRFLNVEDPESATVAVLYDPRSLQVRVDVPLADAAGLEVGQAARIRCSLLPDTVFEGRVTRVTGEADLQRNTLQAKVQLLDPDPRLRPEMLCRVEFLEAGPGAVGTTAAAGTDAGGLLTWVPESALEQGRVWICDVGSRRVQPREVEATPHVRDGYVRVASGVRPGEWVVVSPARLRPDQRVNPRLLEP